MNNSKGCIATIFEILIPLAMLDLKKSGKSIDVHRTM